MAELTIDIKPAYFTIENTQENQHKIMVCGTTTETDVACRVCGEITSRLHSTDVPRKVHHLSICGKYLYLLYPPYRYCCQHCPGNEVTTTATPEFHYAKSQFTYEFEQRLLLELVNSTIRIRVKNMM